MVYHLGSNLGRVQGCVINFIVHVHFLMPLPAGIAAKVGNSGSWLSWERRHLACKKILYTPVQAGSLRSQGSARGSG